MDIQSTATILQFIRQHDGVSLNYCSKLQRCFIWSGDSVDSRLKGFRTTHVIAILLRPFMPSSPMGSVVCWGRLTNRLKRRRSFLIACIIVRKRGTDLWTFWVPQSIDLRLVMITIQDYTKLNTNQK